MQNIPHIILKEIEIALAPELFIGWVVACGFIGAFLIASFIADVLDRRRW